MPSALTTPIYNNVIRYLGDAQVPQEILRRRRLSLQTFRRMGTPVLLKRMFTIDDVSSGDAQLSTNYDTIYGQSTHDDPFSYGIGYVSTETQEGEWINLEGELVIADTPEAGWTPAPKYRGYGPGYLTYAILPDAPEDVFRFSPEGGLLHTQISRTQLPWWPQVGDNDLLIVCEINAQEQIIATKERYQLKQVTPTTMRGLDRFGRREFNADAAGNRFWVGQSCEVTKVPETDPIYQVETDR